jgi:hypothetical protein
VCALAPLLGGGWFRSPGSSACQWLYSRDSFTRFGCQLSRKGTWYYREPGVACLRLHTRRDRVAIRDLVRVSSFPVLIHSRRTAAGPRLLSVFPYSAYRPILDHCLTVSRVHALRLILVYRTVHLRGCNVLVDFLVLEAAPLLHQSWVEA